MTNRTDLDKCLAQIELIRQLITQPETFDIDKVLIELETKKKLLMMFKTRDYARILKGLESGEFIHPGDWVKEEKKIEISPKKEEKIPVPIDPKEPEPERDAEKEELKKELQAAKDKLTALETVKELEKEDPEIILE